MNFFFINANRKKTVKTFDQILLAKKAEMCGEAFSCSVYSSLFKFWSSRVSWVHKWWLNFEVGIEKDSFKNEYNKRGSVFKIICGKTFKDLLNKASSSYSSQDNCIWYHVANWINFMNIVAFVSDIALRSLLNAWMNRLLANCSNIPTIFVP